MEMKYKSSITVLSLLAVLTSCGQKSANSGATDLATQKVGDFEFVHWQHDAEYYNREIDFPVGNNPKLNRGIIDWINAFRTLADTTAYLQTIEEVIEADKKNFEEELSEELGDFYCEDVLTYKAAYVDNNVVTYEAFYSNDISGTAHGTFGYFAATFRKSDGHKLSEEDIDRNEAFYSSLLCDEGYTYEPEETAVDWEQPFIGPEGLCFYLEFSEAERCERGTYFYIPWSEFGKFIKSNAQEFIDQAKIQNAAAAETTEAPAAEEAVAEVSPDQCMEMKGKIGEYPVTMLLSWPGDKASQPAGTYYYDKRPKSIFKLKYVKCGEVDSNNLTWLEQKVVIQEYTAAGNMTGTFDGSIYNRAGNYTSFAGTFTNAKGETFEFDLLNKEPGYSGE